MKYQAQRKGFFEWFEYQMEHYPLYFFVWNFIILSCVDILAEILKRIETLGWIFPSNW